MKILIAPDSFKGSLSADEVCEHIKSGWLKAIPESEVVMQAMADGGEGTLQVITNSLDGELINERVQDALGRYQNAQWGWVQDQLLGVIELAQAAGIEKIADDERDALITTTFGVGELIRCALDSGAKTLLVTLGGSATNDAGTGLLSALGAKFFDKNDKPLKPGGAALKGLHRISLTDLDERLVNIDVQVACDVSNPLCGEKGASAIFGPQKGATPEQVTQLDSALANYAEVVRQQLGIDLQTIGGGGAAGGTAATLAAMLNGSLISGADMVMDTTGFDEKLKGCDLVFTGEGAIDAQTLNGKLPWKVAMAAQKESIPVIMLAGNLGDGYQQLYELENVAAISSIVTGPCNLSQAMASGAENLQAKAFQFGRLFSSQNRIK